MGLEDFLYDGKAKSGSFFVFSAGKIGFVKAFPYFFQAVLWNADTGILTETKTFSYCPTAWI